MPEDDAYRFEVTGPKRKHFNWDVPDVKRAILACLVSSVYSLQHDRSKNYTGTPQALAPPWWTSFNYELLDVILGNDKLRINGAVFVWNYKNHWKPARAPMVVLALRGTDSLTSDYIVDFKIANQELYKTGRFTAAYNALRNAVAWHGKDNVCITGHSLGAAVALSAARMMASHGQFVEAHLFNPPFSSSTAPYKSLFGAETYSNLQEVYTVAKAGFVNLLVDAAKRRESEAEFAALGSWYPDMYVHPSDPVCSGFLEHFKNYQYMLQGKYARLAMPHESIRGVLCSSKAKPHHLIPSARLHVPADEGKAASARDAHSLTQWWSDGAVVQVQFVNLTGQEHLDHPLQIPFGGISYEAMV
ncbi:GDSL esterase/lipase At4g10955 isoform X1 [Selaginella moellendorffii]|nr:GDSL esterase/lipase At4g10955 isoform X1 [Selaginella moellendorffii]|eukprot:XP_024541390.1 GDSL esterase/lipase At4g10955 isoform X1 [Selaginella moellendorffii]